MITKKKNRTEWQKAIDRADAWFSKYIRLLHSENGFSCCVTCGRRYRITYMDCGHYMSRRHLNTRWDERNCGAQCTYCNGYNEGEKQKFRAWIEKTYGTGVSGLMEMNAAMRSTFDSFRIREKAKEFREKYNALKKIKGEWWD